MNAKDDLYHQPCGSSSSNNEKAGKEQSSVGIRNGTNKTALLVDHQK